MDGTHHWGDLSSDWLALSSAGALTIGTTIFSQAGGIAGDLSITGNLSISGLLSQSVGANIAADGNNKLTITNSDHLVTTSASAIKFISTAGCVAGSRVLLTFDYNAWLLHDQGSVPSGYAALYLLLDTGAAGSTYVGTGKPSYEFIYDGTYWRNIGVIVYFVA
jgi:hypothetical protein